VLGAQIAGLVILPLVVSFQVPWLWFHPFGLSFAARDAGTTLAERWHAMQRTWTLLGIPSFTATMFVVRLIMSKQGLFE
jgi:uncharacterized membrane protein